MWRVSAGSWAVLACGAFLASIVYFIGFPPAIPLGPGDGGESPGSRGRPGQPDRVDITRWRTVRGSEVVQVLVPGGGHTIPGPGVGIPERVGTFDLGKNERRFDGIGKALAFFSSVEGGDHGGT
jgi:hypothetical protein